LLEVSVRQFTFLRVLWLYKENSVDGFVKLKSVFTSVNMTVANDIFNTFTWVYENKS